MLKTADILGFIVSRQCVYARIRRRNTKKVSQKRESKVFPRVTICFYQGLSDTKAIDLQ